MRAFDYIIVGAGSAGRVLAHRLSADPDVSVLLIEAGDRDTNPLIAMPRGYAELGTEAGQQAAALQHQQTRRGPLDIDANYLSTEHDRTTSVDVFRTIRRLFATDPLAERIGHETVPGPGVQTDQEIIDAGLTLGSSGYHTMGTCAMGPHDDDVVDPRLRMRGVSGLRIMDASVLPTMVSGNLNGPVSALARRAADFILQPV
jgi:choline dehydrogenase-like flavoprotein